MRVSQLTPRGRGGVALVRVAGDGAEAFLDAAFRPARGRGLPPLGKPALGAFRDSAGASVDEVLLVRVAEDAFELGCHGGPAVVRQVLEVCDAAGAGLLQPNEAALALGLAQTELGCRVLLAQRERLPAALGEAARAIDAERSRAVELLEDLLETSRFGLALTSPPIVALVGPPNSGKSSIMNRLLGWQRVIVAPEAGTTRDAIEDAAVLDGVPVRLLDTAGRRETSSEVEAAGIQRGAAAAADAACTLLVVDASNPAATSSSLEGLGPAPVIVVLNKRDLVDDAALAAAREQLVPSALAISAKTGEGLDALRGALRRTLVGEPDEAGAVLYLPSQVACVENAREALLAGQPSKAKQILATFPPGLTP